MAGITKMANFFNKNEHKELKKAYLSNKQLHNLYMQSLGR